MRVYLPSTLSGLRRLLDTGEVGTPPLPGHAGPRARGGRGGPPLSLPPTLSGRRRLLDGGEVGTPPLPAYAVTGALREWYAEGDEEELGYAAASEGARASGRARARGLL